MLFLYNFFEGLIGGLVFGSIAITFSYIYLLKKNKRN
jgi:hypothetical protein